MITMKMLPAIKAMINGDYNKIDNYIRTKEERKEFASLISTHHEYYAIRLIALIGDISRDKAELLYNFCKKAHFTKNGGYIWG